jgi:circadian clock protein KaiC
MTTDATPPPGAALLKSATGIAGFDTATDGGLPQDRITVLLGGPGTGKTVFALQTLVHACQRGESGIFVSFEERHAQLTVNAATFGWNLPALQAGGSLYFIDGRPDADTAHSGGFTLTALLSGISAKAQAIGARHVVFDSIDMLLGQLDDRAAQLREAYRVRDWLTGSGLTGLLTVRSYTDRSHSTPLRSQLEFMSDCSIALDLNLRHETAQRRLRIVKYRGSPYSEHPLPMLISPAGIAVDPLVPFVTGPALPTTPPRIGTGVATLDALLAGGYPAASCILVSGPSGSGKSVLAFACAKAACDRGERALLWCGDRPAAGVLQESAAHGIALQGCIDAGQLSLLGVRVASASPEQHAQALKEACMTHRATCVAVDNLPAYPPVWASIAERLSHYTRARGATLLCTAITTDDGRDTPVMARLADVWIMLTAGRRDHRRVRELTVIKARATPRADATHLLHLSPDGPSIVSLVARTEAGNAP